MTQPEAHRVSDHSWMERALLLAERGRAAVSPNPMVGACVVRGQSLIAEGYHQAFGKDHAEVMALKKAGRRAQGSVLYVTLEPCASWGKTPPCVQSIIDARIKKVVIGMIDPNPENHRKGIRELKKAGIEVIDGVLSAVIEKQNESFVKYIKTGMPFITLKMAQTLDGKIASVSGSSRWISSKESRRFVHRLRSEQDAVMVGKNTLYQDNPRLSPLRAIPGKLSGKPWRVILDPQDKISPNARVFEGDQVTVCVVSEAKYKNRKERALPALMLPVKSRKGRIDLKETFQKLGELGMAKILVEGGGELAWSLIRERLVDKFYWVVAPKFIGGRDAKTSVEGAGIRMLNQAVNCRLTQIFSSGPDIILEGYLK